MKIKDIISEIERIAPLNLQESYDNAGLIVGDAEAETTGALLCLDSTEEVIQEAIDKKLNLVIAHHPIIFSGLKKINGKNFVERAVIKAIKNNIAIYAAHTNLDNVYNGVNKKIADKLGLKNCRILIAKGQLLKKLVTFVPIKDADNVRQALFNSGAGHIGNYDLVSFNLNGVGTFRAGENANPHVGNKNEMHREEECRIEVIFESNLQQEIVRALISAHPYEEVAYDIYMIENKFSKVGSGMVGELENEMSEVDFLILTKKTFNCGTIKHTQKLNKKIKIVALCGGSGSFLLKDAIAAKADAYISADFKYHEFFDADGKILLIDTGHFENEQFTQEIFYDLLTEKFPKFAIRFTEIKTNPVNYL